jgi:hypothetical protein
MPDEIQRVLASLHFEPVLGLAELKTDFDGRSARGLRNHDLVLIGWSESNFCVVDIEGKTDETFGDLVGAKFNSNGARRSKSKIRDRISELTGRLFHTGVEEVEDLRYQLVYGAYACLVRAEAVHASKAVFVIHELHTSACSWANIERNESDLGRFLSRLGCPPSSLMTEEGGLVEIKLLRSGPHGVPHGIQFFVARAVARISNPSGRRTPAIELDP